jgi:mono/diheme cytochrome c family protein
MMSPVILRVVLRVTLVVLLVVLLAAAAVVYSGAFDMAATRQHTAPAYWVLITALRQSIQAHAAREAPPEPPNLSDAELVTAGLIRYDRYCVPCHGGPGVAPSAVGLGMTPPPPNLVIPARDWTPREIYWTVSNGLKMTGMPAWEFRMTERERWAVVAFVKTLPTLAPAQYRELRNRVVSAPVGQP